MLRNDNDDDYQKSYQDFFTKLALMALHKWTDLLISLICIYMTHMESTQVDL